MCVEITTETDDFTNSTSTTVLEVPTEKVNTMVNKQNTFTPPYSTTLPKTDVIEENKSESDKYSYTEFKEDKLKSSVPEENIEESFSTSKVSCEEQDLCSEEEFSSYALECVQFLDEIPFHDDDIDDNDLEYIDDSILM